MKRFTTLLFCLLMAASYAAAQSGMTDNQVMDFVIEQNANGVSRQQIVTQLMQRGVTIEQIRRIQKKYQKQIKNGALGADDITAGSKDVKERMRKANGEKRTEQKEREARNTSKLRMKFLTVSGWHRHVSVACCGSISCSRLWTSVTFFTNVSGASSLRYHIASAGWSPISASFALNASLDCSSVWYLLFAE